MVAREGSTKVCTRTLQVKSSHFLGLLKLILDLCARFCLNKALHSFICEHMPPLCPGYCVNLEILFRRGKVLFKLQMLIDLLHVHFF